MILIKNYMEDALSGIIDNVLPTLECCKCEKCKYDIMAMALNMLPPKYVVTTKGGYYAKLGLLHQQFDVDIIASITKSAQIVKENPRHDD